MLDYSHLGVAIVTELDENYVSVWDSHSSKNETLDIWVHAPGGLRGAPGG